MVPVPPRWKGRTLNTSEDALPDDADVSVKLDEEDDDDENSEVISEHLQQLGCRIELLNASLLRASLQEDGENPYHRGSLDARLSDVHGQGHGGADSVQESSSPLLDNSCKHGWAALSREALLRVHRNSRSTYLEKLPQLGGTIRSKCDTASVEGRQDILGVRDEALGGRLSKSPLMKSPELSMQPPNASSQEPPVAPLESQHLLSNYIRLFLPSSHLAVRASRDMETVVAVRLLTSTLALRAKFIHKWHIFDSPAVVPRSMNEQEKWSTTEPLFTPQACPILPNLAGRVCMENGVILVYTELSEETPNQKQARMVEADDVTAETSPVSPQIPADVSKDTDGQSQTREVTTSAGTVIGSREASAEGNTSGEGSMPHLNATKATPAWPLLPQLGQIPTVDEYLSALREVMKVAQDPACKTLCYQRLRYLEERFSFHLLFNGSQEIADVRNNNHRDFYNVRKVDTHVHHSACMTQKHLLRFIRHKYRMEGDTVVAKRDGEEVTLAEIFQHDLGLTAWETSMDHLNVHALNSCFHRFDVFNSKYNPFGAALLREVFLKTDNMIGGRFLAELTREVMDDLEENKYQYVEWRISIYGHSKSEWKKLATWVQKHNLVSKNVRWVIQVPRLYHVYRRRGVINSMAEFLNNIFEPVAEAILRPQDNPEIFQLLRSVVAWDSVDDESMVSKFTTAGGDMPAPSDWTGPDNPPYAYWMYYMYANIRAVNHLLQARGMNAMPFRPHCGEAGSISHLATAGLLAEGINHGIVLRKSPVLQYLFFLWQIGLAMSPLSNNALFHEITKSPMNSFFRIGLNVSLSSDDPLMFHFTDEALLEEYSVCAHMWKLSPVDLCELARNSVLQSSFEPQYKRHWLGNKYYKKGPKGNNMLLTNVPDIRLTYREETLREELKFLRDVLVTADEASSILGDGVL